MRTLYHYPLCPFSRKVRVALLEKGLDSKLVEERFWENREGFANLNPAKQVPVLIEENNLIVADSVAICEYLDGRYKNQPLIGDDPILGAEIRRLVAWFDRKLFSEITYYLLQEKIIRYYTIQGAPRSEIIRSAKRHMPSHMRYIELLLNDRKWLAGEVLTMADICAGAHLSVLDYFDEVFWDDYPLVKQWYTLIKTRPSFRPLLSDKLAGFQPPKHYQDLDF